MTEGFLRLFFVTFAMCCFFPGLIPANADAPKAGQEELQRVITNSLPRRNNDQIQITFSVGGIKYRMPRNYLVTMENWEGGPQALVVLRVNVDDMQPRTDATRTCFDVVPAKRPPGCDPLQFNVNAPGGVSADQAFTNARSLFRTQIATPTSFGFEKYEIGPESARTEYYLRIAKGRTLLYSCFEPDVDGNRQGVCRPIGDRTENGAGITFHFPPEMLPKIEKIDSRIRQLVDSFTVAKDQ